MQLTNLLAQNPIFSHLDQKIQEEVARSAISRSYSEGTWIAHYQDNWPYLFMVESGTIRLLKESPEGRSLIITELEQGEVFWGLSFFIEDAGMPVALVAQSDSQLALWSLERLKPYLLDHGEMAWELSRLMIERMQYASTILDEFAFQPVTGRLARLLLDHYGDAVEGYVARDMTLDEMAARIGTTREMVCRQLYHFADEGAIEINRTEFMISNQDLLERIAGTTKG
jgi:CRP/FNR family transcriptional regulator